MGGGEGTRPRGLLFVEYAKPLQWLGCVSVRSAMNVLRVVLGVYVLPCRAGGALPCHVVRCVCFPVHVGYVLRVVRVVVPGLSCVYCHVVRAARVVRIVRVLLCLALSFPVLHRLMPGVVLRSMFVLRCLALSCARLTLYLVELRCLKTFILRHLDVV